MNLQINQGSQVKIIRGGRSVIGTVHRVLNTPNADGTSDSWRFWDLEYMIDATNRPGRWKQNVDGGIVEMIKK
jgi:hypothetical protein